MKERTNLVGVGKGILTLLNTTLQPENKVQNNV
jgi:hypothetical protein